MTSSLDIPILRPSLPPADRLFPYLRLIDESRWYTNSGPLLAHLETRLATHFGVQEGSVALLANGTLGLAVALMAQDARPGTLCILPAWTHVATVQAIRLAGLIPYFADVDADTWALDPEALSALIRAAPREVGAVVVVCPFGQPIDFMAWDAFRTGSGLPVVIDAAAAFDTLLPTATPSVVSLHATKLFGIGEGGLVMSTDAALICEMRSRLNLGYRDTRLEQVPGVNAKLSEYHAAIGNAALDEWDVVRADWMSAAAAYREGFSGTHIRVQPGFGQSWVSSSLVINVGLSGAVAYEEALRLAGIEARHWWEQGAHLHPTTLHLPRTHLPVTERLVRSTIGLPIYRDLGRREIMRVIECCLSVPAHRP